MADRTPPPGDGKGRGLSARQKRFAEEYAIDRNGVQAYMRAFGEVKANGQRRSYFGANQSAMRLLQNPTIQQYLAAAESAHARRVRVSKQRVLRELAMIAFADIGEAFQPDPAGGMDLPRPLSKMNTAIRRALQVSKTKKRRVSKDSDLVEEIEEVEYKLLSKLDALDKLCKKLGFYKDAEVPDPVLSDADALKLLKKLLGEVPAK